MKGDTTNYRSAQILVVNHKWAIDQFYLKIHCTSVLCKRASSGPWFIHAYEPGTLQLSNNSKAKRPFWFLLASLSSGWATKTGKVFGPDEKLAIRGFPKTQRRIFTSRIQPRDSNHSIIKLTFYRLSSCCAAVRFVFC